MLNRGRLAVMVVSMRLRRVLSSSLLPVVLAMTLFEAPGSVAAASPSTAALDDARALRDATGLPSDAQTVENSFRSTDYDDELAGIPLSGAEQKIFIQVVGAQTELGAVATTAASLKEFVGAYFEGPELHLVATDVASMKESLGTALPAGVAVQFETAEYPASELEQAKSAIIEWSRNAPSGGYVRSVYVNPRSGRVEVGVYSELPAVTKVLAEEYGDMVDVIHEATGVGGLLACTVNDCGTKGGLKIVKGAVTCTSGFEVREIGDFQHSDFYLMTAAHCLTDSGGLGSTSSWKNGAGTLTYGRNIAYENQPTNDIGIIGDGATPATRNQYYRGGGAVVSIVGEAAASAQTSGVVVCRNGATSAYDCGAISRANISFRYQDGTAFNNYWEVRMSSTFGDSGAGFVQGTSANIAAGILSGGETRSGVAYTYYNPTVWDIYDVHPRSYSLKVCATAAC